jgi:16S rRNA (guanine966-N2)-methyltransferase
VLRIQGGELRGRTFAQPPGIRPTSQFVREAVFNVLADRVRDARVLELFAGSGALSFEALSRGAASATLVEISQKNARTIRESARKLGLDQRVKIIAGSAEEFLRSQPNLFDLILMDPPYEFELAALQGFSNWLTLDGVVVAEYANRTKQPDWDDLDEVSTKRYGDTRVGFYRPRPNPASR